MTTAVLSRLLRRRPANIAEVRTVRPGQAFGTYTIPANAEDRDGRPYVACVSEEIEHPGGVLSATPGARYLNVWAGGAFTVLDSDGREHRLADGWYAWPDEHQPMQGALL